MKRKNGFTLIELLLYMGLFSIMTIIITDILVATLEIQISSTATNSTTGDGRYIYSRFIHDINNAEAVLVPANLGDITSNLQFTTDGASYNYSLAGNNLILTGPEGAFQLNSFDSSISGLTFKRIGNPNGKHTFRINFTVASRTKLRNFPEIKNFQTTAGLR